MFLAGQQRIGNMKPKQQTFSVLDLSVAFPYTPDDTISVSFLETNLGAECELTAAYTNVGHNAIYTISCSSCRCHAFMVSPPSEWRIHSTGHDLQLQSDWPR